ncbi:MAG TPA: SPW repeat protein [Planctomycetaceae bacterium]|nr:SPW repeat protein [Planctomycetaceae bacterium]
MWPRVVEIMFGCWLGMSPFIFGFSPEQVLWWVNCLAGAVAVMAFALVSVWPPLRHAHLLNCAVAAWLIGHAYLTRSDPVPPALQNQVLVGWLLIMFGVLPNHAHRPPKGWDEFEEAPGDEKVTG